MDTTPQPFDRQPDETSKAYTAFCAYRDLGPRRSLLEAYRATYDRPRATTLPGHFTNWSTKYSWVERVRAWDDHEAQELAKTREGARAEARAVFADHAKSLAEQLVEIALGGDGTSPQVRALVQALDRAGVTAPAVQVEHQHNHRIALREELEKLEDMDAEAAVKAYREALH